VVVEAVDITPLAVVAAVPLAPPASLLAAAAMAWALAAGRTTADLAESSIMLEALVLNIAAALSDTSAAAAAAVGGVVVVADTTMTQAVAVQVAQPT
jgi:hypothetical protein